eukprot:TRINITY_DN830_c0_g1_i1.p1 TRINITY_DN830_c0_g1~~TRINITY_DN830_c0_g1_i1.p1  ORF type:complete len:274 (+),score=49.15 TRINITY_DN830_c0_g1_i1:31-822(+)
MRTHIALLAVLLAATTARAAVMLEVGFDISPTEAADSGYKAGDSIVGYLQSEHLLWLRYFHVLITDHPGNVPMRLTHLMFRDASNWAAFEDEQLTRTHILHDLFWVNSRRVVWNSVTPRNTYPDREASRTETVPGGFTWRLHFTVIPEQREAWTAYRTQQIAAIIEQDLQATDSGFVEALEFEAANFRKSNQELLSWEFLDVKSLEKAVLGSPRTQTFLNGLGKYLSEWSTSILTPPAEPEMGLFFQAQGNPPVGTDEEPQNN